MTLGALFYTKDAGHPVKFVPPLCQGYYADADPDQAGHPRGDSGPLLVDRMGRGARHRA